MADSVTIINNVSSSATSGGNVSTNGAVIEGKSSNSVSVKTIVNGQVVEDYSETSDQPIRYEKTTQNNGSSSVSTSVSALGSVRISGAGSTQVAEGAVKPSESAAHKGASEKTQQPGEVEAPTDHSDDPEFTAESHIAVAQAEAGVATRVFRSVQAVIRSIINLFSW